MLNERAKVRAESVPMFDYIRGFLLVLLNSQPEKPIYTGPLLQQKMFFISRMTDHNFGFSVNYYGVWSEDVYIVLVHLLHKGYIGHPLGSKCHSREHYTITQKGLDALNETPDHLRYWLESKAQPVIKCKLSDQHYGYDMVITYDLIRRLYKNLDNLTMYKILKATGWEIGTTRFIRQKEKAATFRLKY